MFAARMMEAALRSYSGDDPLAPWDEYIKWTEQAYPSGGKDSNLQLLLENCLAQFRKDARYQNDARYVGFWIKLVRIEGLHGLDSRREGRGTLCLEARKLKLIRA